jgi:UDP-glucuronate decarboxylase
MNKILITGASGFIGKNLIPFLQSERGNYYLLSRNPDDTLSFPHLHTISCDLLDHQQVSEVMESIQPTHLLHLAWDLQPGSYDNEENLKWLKASIHLLNEFQKNKGKRWITTGTCFEYDWSWGCCDELQTPLHPDSLYGKTKKLLFDYSNVFCEHHQISCAWPRLFFLYGPYENKKRLFPDVIDSLLKNEPATIQNGAIFRDYMYVKDACRVLNELIFDEFNGAINICSGIPIQLSEIGKTIEEIMHSENLLRIHYPEKVSQKIVYGGTRYLENLLTTPSQYSLKEGLEETIKWRFENLHQEMTH